MIDKEHYRWLRKNIMHGTHLAQVRLKEDKCRYNDYLLISEDGKIKYYFPETGEKREVGDA